MIEIVAVRAGLLPALRKFFADINTDEIRKNFQPHAFTEEQAKIRCGYAGKDEYYALVQDQAVLVYGMLRGWDEGFEIPSLGICVHPKHSGSQLGLLMMYHLVAVARARGAEEIMLKVRKGNLPAIGLYRKLGFTLTEQDSEYLKGRLKLGRRTEMREGKTGT